MTPFLHVHQLVHSNDEISDVESERNFQPGLEIAAIRFIVVDGKAEKHDEAADGRPHDFEELYPLAHDLLLPPSHLLIMQLASLFIHCHHVRVGTWVLVQWLLPLLLVLSLVVVVHSFSLVIIL